MKRPLFLMGLSFLIGALSASFVPLPIQLGIMACLLLGFILCVVKRKQLSSVLCVAAALVAVVYYTGYQQLFVAPLEILDGETLQTTGKIITVNNTDKSARIRLRVREIEGRKQSNFDVDLTVWHNSGSNSQYKPGEFIQGEIEFQRPQNNVYYNSENYYGGKNVHLLGTAKKSLEVIGRESEFKGNLEGRLSQMRDKMVKGIHKLFSEDIAGVLTAVVLGDKSFISDKIRYDFSFSGISHILAMSGLHVTIVAGVFLQLLLFCKIPKKAAVAGTILLMVCYCIMGGMSASLMRATLMTSLYFGAEFFGRKPDSLSAWGVSGVVLVFCRPMIVSTDSFQLSFVAALTVLLCSGPVYKRAEKLLKDKPYHNKFLKGTLSTLGTSALITLFSIPFTVLHYGTFTLLGPIVNIVAIPLVTPILVFGLFTCISILFGFISVASFVGMAAGSCVKLLLFVAERFALRQFTVGLEKQFVLLYLAVVFLLFVALFVNKKAKGSMKTILLLAGAVTCFTLLLSGLKTGIKVTFLPNVQGSEGSLLLQTQKKNVLVVYSPNHYHLNNIMKVLNKKNIHSIDLLLYVERAVDESVMTQLWLEKLDIGTIVTPNNQYYSDLKEVISFDTQTYPLYDMDISLGEEIEVEIELVEKSSFIRLRSGDALVDMAKGEINPKLVEGASLVCGEKGFLNEVKNGMIKIDAFDQSFHEYIAED